MELAHHEGEEICSESGEINNLKLFTQTTYLNRGSFGSLEA
jgi:hypothetical protein